MELIDEQGQNVLKLIQDESKFSDLVDILFTKTDLNGDGIIDYKELKKMLELFSEHYSLPKPLGVHVRLALQAADIDKSGDITKNEFPTIVENCLRIIQHKFDEDYINNSILAK